MKHITIALTSLLLAASSPGFAKKSPEINYNNQRKQLQKQAKTQPHRAHRTRFGTIFADRVEVTKEKGQKAISRYSGEVRLIWPALNVLLFSDVIIDRSHGPLAFPRGLTMLHKGQTTPPGGHHFACKNGQLEQNGQTAGQDRVWLSSGLELHCHQDVLLIDPTLPLLFSQQE